MSAEEEEIIQDTQKNKEPRMTQNINNRKSRISLKQDCYSGILNWGCYNIAVYIPINGTMIDVHFTGEFNVLDDTNKRVVGISCCVVSQSTCERLSSRSFKAQTFEQLIIKDDVDHCNYKIRVKDPFKPTGEK